MSKYLKTKYKQDSRKRLSNQETNVPKKIAKTGAERVRLYRERQRVDYIPVAGPSHVVEQQLIGPTVDVQQVSNSNTGQMFNLSYSVKLLSCNHAMEFDAVLSNFFFY